MSIEDFEKTKSRVNWEKWRRLSILAFSAFLMIVKFQNCAPSNGSQFPLRQSPSEMMHNTVPISQDKSFIAKTTSIPSSRFTFHRMGTAFSNDVLWSANSAIDGNFSTAYSSTSAPTSANSKSAILAAWSATGAVTADYLVLNARMVNGKPAGFPKRYHIYITDPKNSSWLFAGDFQQAPDAEGQVAIDLAALFSGKSPSTFGVLIYPIELGVDPYNFPYFQMADVSLARIAPVALTLPSQCSTFSRGLTSIQYVNQLTEAKFGTTTENFSHTSISWMLGGSPFTNYSGKIHQIGGLMESSDCGTSWTVKKSLESFKLTGDLITNFGNGVNHLSFEKKSKLV